MAQRTKALVPSGASLSSGGAAPSVTYNHIADRDVASGLGCGHECILDGRSSC